MNLNCIMIYIGTYGIPYLLVDEVCWRSYIIVPLEGLGVKKIVYMKRSWLRF